MQTSTQIKSEARAIVDKAEWYVATKVYSRHEDGSMALWYDISAGKLMDDNESERVADEAEADALAAEWLACMLSYED